MALKAVFIIKEDDNVVVIPLRLLACGQLLIQVVKDQALALIVTDDVSASQHVVCHVRQESQPPDAILVLAFGHEDHLHIRVIVARTQIDHQIFHHTEAIRFRANHTDRVHRLEIADDRRIVHVLVLLAYLLRHQLQVILQLQALLLFVVDFLLGSNVAGAEAHNQIILILRNTVEQLVRKIPETRTFFRL